MSKHYARNGQPSLIGLLSRSKTESTTAVSDLDLHIEPGESVGIIGHNGAGKTTLLRLLSGVTAPTTGTVGVTGRIAPLIGVGVGFENELSGHENITVNASILGMSARQRTEATEEIIDFSGLDTPDLSVPVKFYSSGMLLRLAFAVAIHISPDVLLVDELLAVGDAHFQQKCLARMAEIRSGGATVVLVSHSVITVRQLCERTIVLDRGRKVFDGPTAEAISAYHDVLNLSHDHSRPVSITAREITDESGEPTTVLQADQRYTYRCRLDFREPVADPHVKFTVATPEGLIVYHWATDYHREYRTFGADDSTDVTVEYRAALGPGSYHVTLEVYRSDGTTILAQDVEGLSVRVVAPENDTGVARLHARSRLIDPSLGGP